MSAWSLFDFHKSELKDSIAGYAVYDALGMWIGHLSGRVRDLDGSTQMLKVTITEWSDSSEYLIPVGAVTLISDAKSLVQLRDLTKQEIGRLCYRHSGELPEKRLLASLQRHFPAPRPSVVDRLADRSDRQFARQDVLSWTRLSDMPEAADT